MTHYQDLTIIPDEDITLYFLRNKIYSKLHKALYDLGADNIGVSFPQVSETKKHKINPTQPPPDTTDASTFGITSNKLGSLIRLHSDLNQLQKLNQLNWLGALKGYCKISEIQPIPTTIQSYRQYSRIRQNLTNSKLKRLTKRNQLSPQQIQQYKANMFKQGLPHPFIELQSTSTKQRYRIFIQQSELQTQPTTGKFNHFGLSTTANLPHF